MKIITLWQPWASLIAFGMKQYETRSWGTDYRGPLLIHAAKRPTDRSEILPILCFAGGGGVPVDKFDLLSEWLDNAEKLPLGAVVAVCDLTNCQQMVSPIPVIEEQKHLTDPQHFVSIPETSVLERAVGNWKPDRFAWKLENVRRIDPIPWRGAQGLRTASAKLEGLVKRQEVAA